MKRLRKLVNDSVLEEELKLVESQEKILESRLSSGLLSRIRAFLIRPANQLINIGLVVAVILSLTVGTMAQSSATEVGRKGNLDFTEKMKEKTQELYYSDTRTIATMASSLSTFALGDKIEIEIPEDLPETSLAVVDDAYLAKPNIPTTRAPGRPREDMIIYTVQGGDTIISIAEKFGISTDTILWANRRLQLQEGGSVRITPGNRLIILPMNGTYHTVKKGETLKGIASKYHASVAMIRNFNRLDSDELKPGQKLIVPDGKKAKPKPIPSDDGDDVQIADSGYSGYSGYGDATYYGSGGFPYGYCTYYVATRRGDITWRGNAWQWYYNARAQGRAVGRYPVAGAIMVTWESDWGHVAYVEAVYGNGSFTVSEMNFGGWGVVTRRTITTGSVPLIGFIY